MLKNLTLTVKYFLLAMTAVAGLSFVNSHTSLAADGRNFQAGNIINDSIFYNPNSMNPAQIQAFLNAKVPSCRAGYTCLKSFSQATPSKGAEAGLCNTYNGGQKSAAQIIYDVGISCGVNPQVLLVLLQKEQSLITDDWPLDIQYRSATGFACPDSAACDSSYYGFFNQVYMAARQYKLYVKNASSYNYRTGRNNTILWNPSTSCGTSQVFIYSQATAGLYNYTPYRPNQAALNNLYSSGDSCSSYGNRNFWRLFSDWFGSTNGGIELVKSVSSGAVFAWYGGQKQGIPSLDVLDAWAFDGLPVVEMDDTTFNTIPTRENLSRLVKNPYTNGLYLLADDGGTYDTLANGAQNWGLNPASAASIGEEMIVYSSRKGALSPFFTYDGASSIFVADGGSARAFANPEVYSHWSSGQRTIVISPSLFSNLSTGSNLSSTYVTSGSKKTFISGGWATAVADSAANLYPDPTQSVSTYLRNEILTGYDTTRFITSVDGGAIYMVDNGQKHGISSLDLLYSYAKSFNPIVSKLSNTDIGQIPTGSTITSRFFYDSTDNNRQFYTDERATYSLPAQTFGVTSYGKALSPTSISLLNGDTAKPIPCEQGLLQPMGEPGIYILDNGMKRGIPSLEVLGAIQKQANPVCLIPRSDVAQIPTTIPISTFVSNSGTNYILENNKAYSISSDEASMMGITLFTPVSDAFIANYAMAGSMSSSFKTGSEFVLITGGKYYKTTDTRIATLWGFDFSTTHTNSVLLPFTNGGSLTQFARSTNSGNGTIYFVDSGRILPITSLDNFFNLGYSDQNIPAIPDTFISAHLGDTWHGYIARNASNNYFVLEGGRKHPIPTSLISTWIGTSPVRQPTTVSDTFLSLLGTSTDATKSLTSGAPGIYGIENGTIAGIPNLATYYAKYAPATTVTPQLINSMPFGPSIPSV